MASSQDGNRPFVTTPDDHGGIALATTTLLATWMLLCFFLRLYMRSTSSGPFDKDDFLCGIGTVLGLAQTAAACVAITDGFGKSLDLLDERHIVRAQKAFYATQLLYIATNATAKCSVALLFVRLLFLSKHIRGCYAMLAVSVIWGVASLIAQAIRCSPISPWQIVGNVCPITSMSWAVITAFNVAIEVMLGLFPFWLVWNLQTNRQRKVTVVLIFSLRLIVIPAAICRAVYLTKALRSPQPLLDSVPAFICTQIELHYSLMSATFPTLKAWVGAFNTGWGTVDNAGTGGYGGSGSSDSRDQRLKPPTPDRSSSSRPPRRSLRRSLRCDDRHLPSGGIGRSRTFIQSMSRPSNDSSASQQMIIRQTRTAEVAYELTAISTERFEMDIDAIQTP